MKILIKEEQYNKILNEELFLFKNLNQNEKDHIFNMFRNSYTKSTGASWDKEKFYNKADSYLFFGNKDNGFVTVKPNSDGTLKLTTASGNLNDIFSGMSELISTNKPIWGLLSNKISLILIKKYGFILPPKNVSNFLINNVIKPSSEFKFNDDGSLTLNYNDIGLSNKVFVGNKNFFKFLLSKINQNDIPNDIKYYLKSVI